MVQSFTLNDTLKCRQDDMMMKQSTNRLKLHTKPHAAQISAAKAGSERVVIFQRMF